MDLVEHHLIKKSNPNWKELDHLAFASKNLYNKIKENPRRFKPLHGDANSYRLRIMNFRLMYKVVGDEIFMLRFESRDKVYRR